jgi:hypothetical protein
MGGAEQEITLAQRFLLDILHKRKTKAIRLVLKLLYSNTVRLMDLSMEGLNNNYGITHVL